MLHSFSIVDKRAVNVGLKNIIYKEISYRVTPEDQMSTLKPEKLSSPLEISGGWKAGDPCDVKHLSLCENKSNAWKANANTLLGWKNKKKAASLIRQSDVRVIRLRNL